MECAKQESSRESSIDYENMPVFGVGQKRSLPISTYVELHQFIQELVSILEEVFELGILKGSAKRHKITEDEQSADSDKGNEGDNEVSHDDDQQVCPETPSQELF